MKNYKLGNDYAFQNKQKSAEKNQTANQLSVHQSVEPAIEQENVENQISRLGERGLGDETQSEESKQEKETRKKKKETGTQTQQIQKDGQI